MYKKNLRRRASLKAKNKLKYACSECGFIPSYKEINYRRYRLTVHHIDGNIKNKNINNLIILCTVCHGKKHNVKLNSLENCFKELMKFKNNSGNYQCELCKKSFGLLKDKKEHYYSCKNNLWDSCKQLQFG